MPKDRGQVLLYKWELEDPKKPGSRGQRINPATMKPGPHPVLISNSRRDTLAHMTTELAAMNAPPPIEVLHGIENTDVDAVSFYRYEAHLTFENRNRLSFSAPFRFSGEEFLFETPVCRFPLTESSLVRVLGFQVRDLKCDTDGTLDLRFSNGDALIVYANDPAYEAYTLLVDEKEYCV